MSAVVEEFAITRAKRSESRLRLAVCAASNGGKTWSSLELAFGIVEEFMARKLISGSVDGKVGVIDTERKSAGLYAHLGPFDTLQLGPPYSTERYVKALRAMERAGVFVVIIDGISPAWAGHGGLRALLATFKDKDKFSAYDTTINPAQDDFVDAILSSPCHVICTMRSKTEWVLEDKTTRSGYTVKAPRRIGMAPVQRPGIEYEFTTMFEIDADSHMATLVKNRCTLFEGWVPKKLSREHGRQLAGWLLEAEPEAAPAVDGTPLERAQAVLDAACRACDRAATMPDLARSLADGDRNLLAFRGPVSDADLAPMREALAVAKDKRKAELGGDRNAGPGAPILDPVVVEALEGLLRDAGIARERALEYLDVQFLRLIPAARLQVFVAWVNAMAQTPDPIPMPAPLAALGLKWPAPKFEDMEDDIPF